MNYCYFLFSFANNKVKNVMGWLFLIFGSETFLYFKPPCTPFIILLCCAVQCVCSVCAVCVQRVCSVCVHKCMRACTSACVHDCMSLCVRA